MFKLSPGVLTLQHSSPVRAGLDDEEVWNDLKRITGFSSFCPVCMTSSCIALKSAMHKKFCGIAFFFYSTQIQNSIFMSSNLPQTFLISISKVYKISIFPIETPIIIIRFYHLRKLQCLSMHKSTLQCHDVYNVVYHV